MALKTKQASLQTHVVEVGGSARDWKAVTQGGTALGARHLAAEWVN